MPAPITCLVIPPSTFLLDERVFMSLGVLKVAAALEARQLPVQVLDLSGIENYQDAVAEHAAASPDVAFGITATTPQMPAATEIAQTIKRVRPGARTILGGPHVTLVNAASKRERTEGTAGRATRALGVLSETFDLLVAGDGEEAIFRALKAPAGTLIDADIPTSELFLTNAALTAAPFPARHLVDVGSYHYEIEGRKALSLIAQLGCPFECGFCGGRTSPMLRRVRTRTGESIVQEMTDLYREYGVTAFMFYDDELNVNKQMLGLMELIRKAQDSLGVEWRLRGFIKAELFTEAQAAAMFAAGFRWILVGFESGSPRILENINKRATREENDRCLQIARQHGLKVKALMSIGHPGESHETVEDTRRWLLEVRPDDFDVTIITTYPGTPYYDQAIQDPSQRDVWVYTNKRNGDRLYGLEVDYTRVAEYYKGDPDGGYKAYVYTDHLSSTELVTLRDRVERDVRASLGIAFNPAASAIRFEHSMGQFGGALPSHLLKSSTPVGSSQ
jgi:anaerobic magnesium-protoporphyrin IX monomethyl ester cyclase